MCRCFTCDGGLKDWSTGDSPVKEHARYFPHCSYINQLKGQEYVRQQQRIPSDSEAVVYILFHQSCLTTYSSVIKQYDSNNHAITFVDFTNLFRNLKPAVPKYYLIYTIYLCFGQEKISMQFHQMQSFFSWEIT